MGLLGTGLVAFGLLAVPVAASAVPPGTIGTYPTWNVTGSAGSFSGTANFASPSMPNPTVQTNSSSVSTPSGESAYLGANTGFGQDFGSTRKQPYLTLRANGTGPAPTPPSTTTPAPSLTTIDFGAAGPAPGWGFVLGDIDADWVFVRGYDATGAQLPVSALGMQSTGNYCENASPKPSVCSGTAAPFDVPNWVPGPNNVTVPYGSSSISYAPGTVYGNVSDTSGAYIWFTPTAAVTKITLLYGALNGSPNYQLWLAQPAPMTTITGTVVVPGGSVPPDTSVQVNDADGTPVEALTGDPLTVPVQPDGSFSIETEQRPDYQLVVVPPAGFDAPPPVIVPATSASVVAPTMTVTPVASTPTPTPTVSTPSSPEPTDQSGTLADSGSDVAPWLAASAAVMLLGWCLIASRRRVAGARRR